MSGSAATTPRLLIVTAVAAETRAIGEADGALVITAGLGRTNAAAATTEAILKHGPFDAVFSAGVAGALPGSGLAIGDVVLADRCVYIEEGLFAPSGFEGMAALGYSLGDFQGNVVPVDPDLFSWLRGHFRTGSIATVATCSGTDTAAAEVVRRSNALAEAMEGAAVVHTARRLGAPAIELRAISNTTGDRDKQQWNLRAGLDAIGEAVRHVTTQREQSL